MSKRILIAEDEQTTRELLTDLATKHGFEVVTVANGVDLLNIATVERFDAIITDLMMADLDGVSAAKIMRLQENTTPVIALTGVSEHDIVLCKDSFTKIYKKPVIASELFTYIDSLTGQGTANV